MPGRLFPPWMGLERLPTGLPTGVTVPPRWLQRELAERGGRVSWFLDASPKARHGRREVRVFWALADPEQNAYVGSSGTHRTPWPHLRQICCVERHRLMPAEVADEEVPRDSRQPTQRLVRRSVRPPMAQRAKPGFLRDILSQFPPPAATPGHIAVQLGDGRVVDPFQLGFGYPIGHRGEGCVLRRRISR